MNKLRVAVSAIFQSPIQNMTFIHYLQYVNEAGKITGKTLLELNTVTLTYIEEMEKKLELYDANFNEIKDILSKLVDKKVEEKIPIQAEPKVELLSNLQCPIGQCDFVAKSSFGLQSHLRTHK